VAHSRLHREGYHLVKVEGPLKQVRILLGRMPKMLIDILYHVVASELDLVIVGLVNDDESLPAAVRRTRAEVVLTAQTAEDELPEYASLLVRRPRLKVVAITGDGRTGLLYELRPQRIPLGEMSAVALYNAIRGRPQSNAFSGP
jgi:hypothetical protein